MQISSLLAYFYWDPPREIFRIPFIDHPVVFYGAWFVLGFMVSYFIVVRLLTQKLQQDRFDSLEKCRDSAALLTDRLTWFVILGTLIGARLGHVFFYEWPLYQDQPLEIFKIWKGGLASHGGVLGVMAALCLFRRSIKKQFPTLTFIAILDLLVIPSGLVGCCIRIGNFFNQEILGPETSLPWGVIFGHPMEGGPVVPRHPTQLYEAIAYFAIFCLLTSLWRRRPALWPPGYLSGLFFILLFTTRFFLEFIKESQGYVIDESLLQTGQLLSLPFILLGFVLYRYGPKWDLLKNSRQNCKESA